MSFMVKCWYSGQHGWEGSKCSSAGTGASAVVLLAAAAAAQAPQIWTSAVAASSVGFHSGAPTELVLGVDSLLAIHPQVTLCSFGTLASGSLALEHRGIVHLVDIGTITGTSFKFLLNLQIE